MPSSKNNLDKPAKSSSRSVDNLLSPFARLRIDETPSIHVGRKRNQPTASPSKSTNKNDSNKSPDKTKRRKIVANKTKRRKAVAIKPEDNAPTENKRVTRSQARAYGIQLNPGLNNAKQNALNKNKRVTKKEIDEVENLFSDIKV
jgi:hypothetical protein